MENHLIRIGKLKQKFAELTNDDILFVEGGKDIIEGHNIEIVSENIQEKSEEMFVKSNNK